MGSHGVRAHISDDALDDALASERPHSRVMIIAQLLEERPQALLRRVVRVEEPQKGSSRFGETLTHARRRHVLRDFLDEPHARLRTEARPVDAIEVFLDEIGSDSEAAIGSEPEEPSSPGVVLESLDQTQEVFTRRKVGFSHELLVKSVVRHDPNVAVDEIPQVPGHRRDWRDQGSSRRREGDPEEFVREP